MEYRSLTKEQLENEKAELAVEYNHIASKGLKLDMSRGKPNKEQLDLTEGMLSVISCDDDCKSESGTDCRNYGVLDGIPEAKKLFSDLLGIPTKNTSRRGQLEPEPYVRHGRARDALRRRRKREAVGEV